LITRPGGTNDGEIGKVVSSRETATNSLKENHAHGRIFLRASLSDMVLYTALLAAFVSASQRQRRDAIAYLRFNMVSHGRSFQDRTIISPSFPDITFGSTRNRYVRGTQRTHLWERIAALSRIGCGSHQKHSRRSARPNRSKSLSFACAVEDILLPADEKSAFVDGGAHPLLVIGRSCRPDQCYAS
jgi:hypothetical protein